MKKDTVNRIASQQLKLPSLLLKLEDKNRKIFFKSFIRYLRYARKSIPAMEYESFIINRMSDSLKKRLSSAVDLSNEKSCDSHFLKDIRSFTSESEYFAPSVRLTYDSPGLKFSPFSKISVSRETRELEGNGLGSSNSSSGRTSKIFALKQRVN